MLGYKKAILIIKKSKIKINSEIILSINSVNRVCASDVYSPYNYPAANNTSFDGYAVSSKDTKNLTKKKFKKFKILKTLAAGDNPKIQKIPKYSTIEVMTGAIIQKPFDAVIPVEKIKLFTKKKKYNYIIVDQKINKNDNIRFEGSDFKKGKKVITKGELIKPQHILAFKALGIKKILVKKIPKIVFFTTGNEISNSKNIPKWKVRNSNGFYLKSYLKNFPIKFLDNKILRDNEKKKFYNEIIKNLKTDTDIIITSGAVSKGKFDFVPEIIEKFKLSNFFKGALIRPGKPILFAKFRNKNKVFFGLPGNPISSAACFRFFVYPFILTSLGIMSGKSIKAKLKNKFVKKKSFTRFVKGLLVHNSKGYAEFKVLKGQESFKILPFTKSNAWGVFGDKKSVFKKGDLISCFSL